MVLLQHRCTVRRWYASIISGTLILSDSSTVIKVFRLEIQHQHSNCMMAQTYALGSTTISGNVQHTVVLSDVQGVFSGRNINLVLLVIQVVFNRMTFGFKGVEVLTSLR